MRRWWLAVASLATLVGLSACDALQTVLDVVPPIVTVISPPVDGALVGDEQTFELLVVDVSEIVSVRYDTPTGVTGACTGSRTNGFTCASVPITFGLVEVTFTAEDATGLVGTATRSVLKVTPSLTQ